MKDATDTIQLPQHSYSEELMERFLQAIHEEGAAITRSPDTKGIKQVDGTELSSDSLDYFINNKSNIENEFYDELVDKIGVKKASLFCAVISKYWYDGRKKRKSRLINSLKWAVRSYLEATIHPASILSIVQNDIHEPKKKIFDANDIACILTINDQNLYKHISSWNEQHKKSTEFGRGDIFFKRGLSCDQRFPDKYKYKEWDFINSYSFAFSAPEQFSQMVSTKVAVMLSADCDYF